MTNRIRERRRALNMSQPQLAEILRETDPRIDVGMVSRFETEVCMPTETVLQALERALQADRSDLYGTSRAIPFPEYMDDATSIIASLVPFGKENAISRAQLAAKLGMSDRMMRATVSHARRMGLIIINDQTGSGYYQSEDLDDLRRQRRQLHNRAMSLLKQETYLNRLIKAAGGDPQ